MAAAASSSADSGCGAFLGGLPTPRRFVRRGGAAPPLSTAAAEAAAAASVAVADVALALTDLLPGEAGSCDEGGDGDDVDAEACERLRGCGRAEENRRRRREWRRRRRRRRRRREGRGQGR